MTQIPGSWKQCATCAFWCGNRSVYNFGSHVCVNGSTESGKCEARSGGWQGTQRQASGAACSSYQKWPALK